MESQGRVIINLVSDDEEKSDDILDLSSYNIVENTNVGRYL